MTLHDCLIAQGYRLSDDAWDGQGRITYLHDDDADRGHLTDLVRILSGFGWNKNRDKLRSFINSAADEEIEVEPGGSEVSGHYLHRLKIVLSLAIP